LSSAASTWSTWPWTSSHEPLLLPIVLGLLLALEARALPERWRMPGLHKYTGRALWLVVMGFGLYMVPQALGWT
jgi:hypothetical protein